MLGQGVEEGVRGGVVGLPRPAQGTGGGGEHHERRQVQAQVTRQFVQMPGCVDLRPQYGADAFLGEGADHAVVEHPGGVHHGGYVVPGQQLREGGAVGDVAGHGMYPRAEPGQFGDEGCGAGGLGSTSRREQQVPYAVFGHEVTGQHRAQAAGATGDQDRAGFVPAGGPGSVWHAGQPGGEDLPVADEDFRFRHGQRPRQQCPRYGVVARGLIQVEQGDAVGVFGLRGPQQAPRRCRSEVTGGPGHQDQPGTGEPLVRQPVLYEPQRPRDRGVDGVYRVLSGYGRELRQHHVRDRVLHERVQVRVYLNARVALPQSVGQAVTGGIRLLAGAQVATRPNDGDGARPDRAGPCRYGRPVEAEQRIRVHGRRAVVQPTVRDRASDEGVNGRDQITGRVGDGDRHGVVLDPRQPGPHRRSPGRVQRHALPGEREAALADRAEVGEGRGVLRGVEKGRVEAERTGIRRAARLGLPGEGDLGEQLGAPAPGRPQALERRAVGEAQVGEVCVAVAELDRLGALRRPHRGVECRSRLGRAAAPAEQARGVLGPRGGIRRRFGPRVDRDGTAAVAALGAHAHLDPYGTLFGQHQWRGQREFIDPVAAELVARADRQLQEGRARHQNAAAHHMVGEPGMGLHGQAAGEHGARAVGELHRRAQQRMVRGTQPEPGGVPDARGARGPVPSALEHRGRQVHAARARAREQYGPVDRRSRHMQPRQTGDEGEFLSTVLAQRRDGDGVVRRRVPDQRREHPVRAQFQEGPYPLAGQGPDPIGEPYGLTDVAYPVLR